MPQRNHLADALDLLNHEISGLILKHRERVAGATAKGPGKEQAIGKKPSDGMEPEELEPEDEAAGQPEVEPDADDMTFAPLGRKLLEHQRPVPAVPAPAAPEPQRLKPRVLGR